MALIQNVINFNIQNRSGQLFNSEDNTPWIQIVKNENCFNTVQTFPQVKLISRNLYMKDNAGTYFAHRMWGFPLFDISSSIYTRDSTSWTYYNDSSLTVKPNLTRLDLSRNLVVLDFQNLTQVIHFMSFKYYLKIEIN